MSAVSPQFQIVTHPVAHPEAVVDAPHARFTVLTSRLIRLEYSPDDQFEDRASQAFWYRGQPVPPFEVRHKGGRVEIITEHLHLTYRAGEAGFTPETLSIKLKETRAMWHYGDPDPQNLRGTYRTLDGVEGGVPLESGLVSRSGWAVVDDSRTLVFREDGWLAPRRVAPGTLDLYFFGYGQDYTACLHDYRAITGPVPLIPRWVLGNWWSRYWAYTQEELRGLMEDFRAHGVPLGVCIIDMDWHITETGNASSGWTGYTWNRDLFPDPWGFVAWLHKQGLRVALNVHPADGVYPHEEQYAAMARATGIDPKSKKPVPFDIADPEFTEASFDILYHPYEEQGIDFWWLDWQQGTLSGLPGLDPLWWINHLHFYDLGRDGRRRPFIFSRWGGLGNHRYPIGFSGDTIIAWESLAFQPRFTATAANVAYGWWSHDIGGHYSGIEDSELYTRWVQFGVFSPVFRLHSTNNVFHDRRPWGHGAEVFRITRDAMTLRHRLIPYLYTMAWRDHSEGLPLARPLYHLHPDREEAYLCPDEYAFGSELIAAPFVSPADVETRLARQVVWLPEGDWFDFFSGEYFAGDSWHAIYDGLDRTPVFAKAGAIVPLGPEVGWDGLENPSGLEIAVFPGADNRFDLYEDDGETTTYQNGAHCRTPIMLKWEGKALTVQVGPADGSTGLIPKKRAITLLFQAVVEPGQVQLEVNGQIVEATSSYDPATDSLRVGPVSIRPGEALVMRLEAAKGTLLSKRDRRVEAVKRMLRAFAMNSFCKAGIWDQVEAVLDDPATLARFRPAAHDAHLRALIEATAGVGCTRVEDATGQDSIVLWNNYKMRGARYALAARKDWTGYGLTDRTIPRYLAFRPGERRWKPWSLRADYFGVTEVAFQTTPGPATHT